jgi:hypothetical protein
LNYLENNMNIKKATVNEILNAYSFSQRFYTLFACACAKDALSYVKNPDPVSVKAVEVAYKWAKGEATYTQAELKKNYDNANRIASYAAIHAVAAYVAAHEAAYNAAYAAHIVVYTVSAAAANATHAANAAAYTAHTAVNASSTRKKQEAKNKQMLLTMIKKELINWEKQMLGLIK